MNSVVNGITIKIAAQVASESSNAGMERTKTMESLAGRSNYISIKSLNVISIY
jgi:hypothetical protein